MADATTTSHAAVDARSEGTAHFSASHLAVASAAKSGTAQGTPVVASQKKKSSHQTTTWASSEPRGQCKEAQAALVLFSSSPAVTRVGGGCSGTIVLTKAGGPAFKCIPCNPKEGVKISEPSSNGFKNVLAHFKSKRHKINQECHQKASIKTAKTPMVDELLSSVDAELLRRFHRQYEGGGKNGMKFSSCQTVIRFDTNSTAAAMVAAMHNHSVVHSGHVAA